MLHIVQSNRMEQLALALVEQLRAHPAAPMQREWVLVPHPGMADWVQMVLAQQLGVCAQVEFPLPARWLWQLLLAFKVVEAQEVVSPFHRDSLRWRVLEACGRIESTPLYQPLQRYLQAASSDDERFYLAEQIAAVFDQYLVYRPEWMLDWQHQPPTDWQMALWQTLVTEAEGAAHRALLQQQLEPLLSKQGLDQAQVPQQIYAFVASGMAPSTLGLLQRLAEHREVYLLVLNPCEFYWGDMTRQNDPEQGHPLLRAWGGQVREFIELLHDLPQFSHDAFQAPSEGHLLAQLQQDLLMPSWELAPLQAVDRLSIEVHACHSRLRELEVLQQYLIQRLADDPELLPSDILVVCPQLTAYLPLIHAVFAQPEQASVRLPYASVASHVAEDELLAAAMALLQALLQPLGATELLALLEWSVLRQAVGIQESELPWLEYWAQQTQVRATVEDTDPHSWRWAVDRLLLGFTLGDEVQLFAEHASVSLPESQQLQVLLRLSQWLDQLLLWRQRWAQPQPLATWAQGLRACLRSFFAAYEDHPGWSSVMAWCDALQQQAQVSQTQTPISLRLLVSLLQQQWQGQVSQRVGLRGGVTFSPMTAMRNVPFKVVAVLGLDEGALPRLAPRIGFDRLLEEHRPGDRSRQLDDRGLFLDYVLAARDDLFLSYQGFDIRDNQPRSPSLLVSELLDYVEGRFCLASRPETSLRSQLCHAHPLHRFSPQALQQASFVSEADYQVATALGASGRPAWSGAGVSLPLAEPATSIALEDLVRFFTAPAASYLDELGVQFQHPQDSLLAADPVVADGLTRYQAKQQVVAWSPQDDQQSQALLMAQGGFADNALGQWQVATAVVEGAKFAQASEQHQGQLQLLRVQLGGVEISHACPLDAQGRLLGQRLGQYGPKDKIQAWLQHLLYCCAVAEGEGSAWLDEQGVTTLPRVENAQALLAEWLAEWQAWRGRPMPFAPKTSWQFAASVAKGKSADEAISAALTAWLSPSGEGQRAEYAWLWPDQQLFGHDFAALADRLLVRLVRLWP